MGSHIHTCILPLVEMGQWRLKHIRFFFGIIKNKRHEGVVKYY